MEKEMSSIDPSFKYFAFISYSSHDTAWGKRLQRKLEDYSIPASLRKKHGWKRCPMRPIFFAPSDIQPGGLTLELQNRLRDSKYLIVIGSPYSAKSKWVAAEIEFFHNLGRTKNIFYFIVDGIPHSGDENTECFNPIVEELKIPEILGVNIHEKVHRFSWMNKERAYIQLVTKLLGIEFDTLWQRHKRYLIEQAISWTFGVILIASLFIGVWITNKPVDVTMKLNEASVQNKYLPPLKDAIITMSLDNEIKTDTIARLSDEAIFTNIPHRFLNEEINITVTCKDFVNVDTTLVLSQNVVIDIMRNPSIYGNINFTLWNSQTENAVSNCELEIDGHKASTDENGTVSLFIPLPEQKPSYHVSASISLMNDTIYMPCGQNDILLIR